MSMTPQERILAAIRGEQVDRLPAATYNFHGFSWSGHTQWRQYAPMLEAIPRTDTCMLCKLYLPRTGGPPQATEVRTIDSGETITTTVLETPAGALRQVHRKPPDQPSRLVEPFIKTDEDIKRFISLPLTPARVDVHELRRRCKEIGPRGLAYVHYDDPFGRIVTHFAQEDILIRIVTDPQPLRGLLDRAFEHIREGLEALLKELAEDPPALLFYTTGPELACPPLMSPKEFAWLVSPYQKRLVALIHKYGFAVSAHCHGRVSQVLDEMLECDFDLLEPIEPPPQGDIDLAELRRRTRGRIALLGYMQDQDLYTATVQEIREHVAMIAREVGRDTRFIVAPTCTPFDFPPSERYVANYVAFLEAAAEFGSRRNSGRMRG
ncbi:MAG: hypothetical protein J7M14_02725 [Planctomycetes bacterium]|nr:hypothetical protein [Planctomycetota bacterium]